MRNKRGQVTIFIIIAIIIIAIAILIYIFYPQLKSLTQPETKNPNVFVQTCLKDEIEDTVEILSLQGGSVDPEHYHAYLGNNIEYLCYTNEDYLPCVVQQPMLKSHIETEIETEIQSSVDACFTDLKQSFEDQGYDVNLIRGETIVELLPERIITTINNELTLTKGNTERYEEFRVILSSNLYGLVGIVNSIINWEAIYGEADPGTYMDYYHYLKVERKKRDVEPDKGTRIYILTNKESGDMFQFATRSIVLPPGI